MEIRKIQPKDNQAIATIIRDSLQTKGLNIPGTAYFDTQLDNLYEFYQATPKSAYWVLVDGEEVVGGVGVGPFLNEVGELQKLYLASSALGQGYGQKLLEVALTFSRQHYQQLYLETFASLSAANRLYEKNQFSVLTKPLGDSGHNACDSWFLKEL